MIVSFDDMLDHMLAVAGSDAGASATNLHRRAIQNAYAVLPTRHDWSYLRGIARVVTNAPYLSGTIAYDYTGGAYERVVTLTGGTWPTWIASGYIIVNNVPYQVEARKSATEITLTEAQAPTSDIAALTTYAAQQDQYPLPTDFVSGDEAVVNDIGTVLSYSHPREWSSQRRSNMGPGQPWTHTYLGSSTRGRLAIAIWPPPDAAYVIDILYKRMMRPLVHSQVSDGLVSATAASATITGNTTAFTSGMVGSIIRFGTSPETIPTGPTGGSPALVERTITGYTSATEIEVDSVMPSSLSNVAYLISDPVDLDVTAMYEYFCRECERQWRLLARSKAIPEETAAYERAWTQAREADNRDESRAAAGRMQSRRSGFGHYPIDFGV